MPRIHIGTSGFSYADWKENFYRGIAREKDMLAAYSATFDSVEINQSFYRLPSPDAVKQWIATVPPGFVFSYKANRFLTHRKRLKDFDEPIERLVKAVEPFGTQLGPILFQLPPRWQVNVERLKGFVAALPRFHQYTFEFRDPSWLCEEVYTVLERHNAALCFYDFRGFQSPERITADFVYIRLHGPNPEAYTGSYSDEALARYAEKIAAWKKQGIDVYCYFDNDQKGCAPKDAQALNERLLTGAQATGMQVKR